MDDRVALVRMKELIAEMITVIDTGLDEKTPINKGSLHEALLFVELGVDMEILKLDEHSQD